MCSILLMSKTSDIDVKITDFGLSKIVALAPDAAMSSRCGTPGYVAPEVLTGGTSGSCWSCFSFTEGEKANDPRTTCKGLS